MSKSECVQCTLAHCARVLANHLWNPMSLVTIRICVKKSHFILGAVFMFYKYKSDMNEYWRHKDDLFTLLETLVAMDFYHLEGLPSSFI